MTKKIKNLLVSLDNIKVNEKSIEPDELIKKIEQLRKKDNITTDELITLQNYEKNLVGIYEKNLQESINKEKKNVKVNEYKDDSASPILNNIIMEEEENQAKEKPDLMYSIEISQDEMKAYISFYNISERFDLTEFYIIDLLKRNNIVKGIIEKNIKMLIEEMKISDKIENFLVAEGRQPGKGKDGFIKYMLEHNSELEKLYREKSKSKKFWKLIVNKVKNGDILAEKIPPQKGHDGYTVTGKKISGLEGIDASLKIKRNVKYSDFKYIAEIDGEAIIENMEIRVRRYAAGHFKINISPDKMVLRINLFPAIGDGIPINIEKIKEELFNIGIKANIDYNILAEKIQECEFEKKAIYDLIIARGEEPINGKDGYIKYKVTPGTGKNFQVLPDGRVNYKERDIITTIKSSQLIAIVYLPEEGKKDGKNVFGKNIFAQPGRVVRLKTGKNIFTKEYSNRIEYYSEIDGHLKTDNEEVYVLPVYIQDGDVDLSIGNINFPGDVIIKGDVLDEFKVIAEGDIFIEGNVGAAVIKSDRSIIIKKGIMSKSKGIIYAGGSIVAKFIENGIVEADGNIIVEKAVINSNVFSNSIVSVLLDKGQIIGGHVAAGLRIEAKVVGSPTGIKTELSVGYNFIIKRELDNLKVQKEKLNKDLDRVEEIIAQLFNETPDIKNFSEDMKNVYVESIRKKTIIMNELNKNIESDKNLENANVVVSNNPEIVVYDYIYSDVKINFLDNTFITRDKNVHVKIKYDSEKNVVFDMLM